MKHKTPGQVEYERWRDEVRSHPEHADFEQEEVPVLNLWLALADARRAAGLTQAELAERMGISQAQVARIEKLGYDSYTLKTLRRYAAALGEGFRVDISIYIPEELHAVLLEPNPLVQLLDEDGGPSKPKRGRAGRRRSLVATKR